MNRASDERPSSDALSLAAVAGKGDGGIGRRRRSPLEYAAPPPRQAETAVAVAETAVDCVTVEQNLRRVSGQPASARAKG